MLTVISRVFITIKPSQLPKPSESAALALSVVTPQVTTQRRVYPENRGVHHVELDHKRRRP